ncbi:MAG: DNA repair protein RecN [Firmicutes bacterium]|nr:DNA repair protein RecN [Bacillota bacterium]
MLRELHIENFALVDRLDLAFSEGFNVLTGETGAGKSIIIDAVNMLLGGRASVEYIREGSETARIDGAFDLEPGAPVWRILLELGLVEETVETGETGRTAGTAGTAEDTLILSREISRAGKSRCRINGRAVTLQVFSDVGRELVDLHGQHEHQSLLVTSRHIFYLDAFGGQPLAGLRAHVADLHRRFRDLQRERHDLEENEAERARREDLLRFQHQEISSAMLSEGEEEELARQRLILQNGEKLLAQAQKAYQALYDGGEAAAAVDQLAVAQESLGEMVKVDPSLASSQEMLQAALAQIEEAARTVGEYRERIETDPERLEQVEDRLDLINRLKRKYGSTVGEIIAFGKKVAADLESLANSDERRRELEAQLQAVSRELGQAAARLSEARQKLAGDLEKKVEGELADLNMAKTRFVISLEREPDPEGVEVDGQRWRIGANGLDQVEFLFSANPGESPRPLARIVSGGEMSRVMLALKSLMALADRIPTLIFDEIDTGISGRTAQSVAEKLCRLARQRQVICVTHLPQIASMATTHFFIEKSLEEERTVTHVHPLGGEGRVQELARLLGGAVVTDTTLRHAREMIQQAGIINRTIA